MRLEIYSDGAAMNNGKAGGIGYAAVLLAGGEATGYAGGEWMDPSSSNVAELKAILLGLSQTAPEQRQQTDLHVYTDSEWSVNVIRGRFQAQSHLDLIGSVRGHLRLFRTWELGWVRGHCGHQYNEQAHRLANAAARRAERKQQCPAGPSPSAKNPPSTRSSASASSRPTRTAKRPPVSRDLVQARLDVIAFPCFAWNRENCKWQSRYTDHLEWPLEGLLERRSRLLADIRTLEALVKSPPAEWDGIAWTEMHERLQGWLGHLHALDRALDQRSRMVASMAAGSGLSASSGSTWRAGRTASTSTPAAVLAASDDPFQWE